MTAPEQMRALADMEPTDDDALLSPREWIEAARSDLRAAANELDLLRAANAALQRAMTAIANRSAERSEQLAAVRDWAEGASDLAQGDPPDYDALLRILRRKIGD